MAPAWLPDESMENYPWQLRARKAGLSQRMLSRILGHLESTVSSQLRGHWASGVPQHVRAAILAWEEMTPEQRLAWVAKIEQTNEDELRKTSTKKVDDAGSPDTRALQKEIRELKRRLAKAESR